MNRYKVSLTIEFTANVQEENEEKAVELLAWNIGHNHVEITGIRDAGIYKLNNMAMKHVSSKVVELP